MHAGMKRKREAKGREARKEIKGIRRKNKGRERDQEAKVTI